jgi:hypothetical protein
MATLPTKITTLEPDSELQTEIMAVAMILNERRPGYQRYGAQRQLQLHQAALDLRAIADRIDAGLELQQRVAEKLLSHNGANGSANGSVNGNADGSSESEPLL